MWHKCVKFYYQIQKTSEKKFNLSEKLNMQRDYKTPVTVTVAAKCRNNEVTPICDIHTRRQAHFIQNYNVGY
jgi:hypothetical protein